MKAIWNNQVIAQSDDTIQIEGNHYFPPSSLKKEFFSESDQHSTCLWKGEASYYDLEVDGQSNPGAAWYYPHPRDGAAEQVGQDFTNYVGFWRGVEVTK